MSDSEDTDRWKTVEYRGKTYEVRELTFGELESIISGIGALDGELVREVESEPDDG